MFRANRTLPHPRSVGRIGTSDRSILLLGNACRRFGAPGAGPGAGSRARQRARGCLRTQAMIYLEHNATSPVRACARHAIATALEGCGNAFSIDGPGRAARACIEKSREQVSKLAGCAPSA